MWIIVIVVVLVIIIVVLLCYYLLKRLRRKKRKDVSHVSISFPLPPPTGESEEIMDETQYDVHVKALRESKESSKEGSADLDAEPMHTVATLIREEKRDDPKLPGPSGNKKEPRFLFEAPPPYEEQAAVPPGQRRMVAIKLADLPVRKAGDMRVLETGSNPSSSMTAAMSDYHKAAQAQTGSSENTARSARSSSSTLRANRNRPRSAKTQPSKTNKEYDKAVKVIEDGESSNALKDKATQESAPKEQGSKELASKEADPKLESNELAGSKELGSKEMDSKEQGSENPAVKEQTAVSETRRRSRGSKRQTPSHTPALSQTQQTDNENMY